MSRTGSWKDIEKKVAEETKGKRIKRTGNYSESAEDVKHPVFIFECKYRSKLPKFIQDTFNQAKGYKSKKGNKNKIPIIVFKEKGLHDELCGMLFSDFMKIIKFIGFDDSKEIIRKFKEYLDD